MSDNPLADLRALAKAINHEGMSLALHAAADAWETQVSELSRQVERMTWRPIATAPDDDTEILVSGFDPDAGEQERYVSTGCKIDGAYYAGFWEDRTQGNQLFDPTHWMPLPALPFSSEQS